MNTFRRLMVVVLWAGALAGLLLFAVQHFTVVPLIEAAEQYEHGDDHHAAEWKPSPGAARAAFTALTTILTGIGFAALLFGCLEAAGHEITIRRAVTWALAAYACIHLAPAFGLPPLPPGVPVPDVEPRQLWWAGTVLATAAGLWLLTTDSWFRRIAGVLCLAIPHLIGAPSAIGTPEVPASLIRSFTIASLATTASFWLFLGAAGGFIASRARR